MCSLFKMIIASFSYSGWIAKVTSSLHDQLPGFQKPRKIKFWESSAACEKPEVSFTNIGQTGSYFYKGN